MLGRQFEQQQLFEPPKGGGQSSPIEGFLKRGGSVKLRNQVRDNKIARFSNQELQMNPHGEQLPMFMTAREITSKYQALDGDREEHEQYLSDSRAGSLTKRSHNTAGSSNFPRYFGNAPVATDEPGYRRPDYKEYTETDEQLYERKYEEASQDPEEYSMNRGQFGGGSGRFYRGPSRNSANLTDDPWIERQYSRTNTWGPVTTGGKHPRSRHQTASWSEREPHEKPSLRDSIVNSGVKSPIRLGQTIGSMGKPEVVGGHHRLAVMQFDRPDDLIPVLHHRDLMDAKMSREYRYT